MNGPAVSSVTTSAIATSDVLALCCAALDTAAMFFRPQRWANTAFVSVNSNVFGAVRYLKVFYAVVVFYAVLVMDNLSCFQRASKMFGHNLAMLQHKLTMFAVQAYIAVWIYILSTLPSWGVWSLWAFTGKSTSVRAIGAVSTSLAYWSRKLGAAQCACVGLIPACIILTPTLNRTVRCLCDFVTSTSAAKGLAAPTTCCLIHYVSPYGLSNYTMLQRWINTGVSSPRLAQSGLDLEALKGRLREITT